MKNPNLIDSIMNISIQNLVQIDVEIRNAERSELFYLNDEMARKIDNQMYLFLDFIDCANKKPSKFFGNQFPEEFGPKKLYYNLLDIFDK